MKRLLAILLLALPLAAPAAENFVSGRDFQEVAFPVAVETGNKIEVREFFWYGCPHCYDLEPYIEKWLKTKPANAQLVRTPGMYEPWVVHAQMFYTLEALGALEKVHSPLLRAIHVDKRLEKGDLRNEASLAEFAAAYGVDRKRFAEAWKSFAVNMKLQNARRLNADLGISGVPAFVVDGRYVTSPVMAGGEDRAMRVVDFLIARAAKARARGR